MEHVKNNLLKIREVDNLPMGESRKVAVCQYSQWPG